MKMGGETPPLRRVRVSRTNLRHCSAGLLHLAADESAHDGRRATDPGYRERLALRAGAPAHPGYGLCIFFSLAAVITGALGVRHENQRALDHAVQK